MGLLNVRGKGGKMALRFRKSFKIAPGVKLNLNKKSTSITFGTRGAHYTINSKGKRTKSIGIPGTEVKHLLLPPLHPILHRLILIFLTMMTRKIKAA